MAIEAADPAIAAPMMKGMALFDLFWVYLYEDKGNENWKGNWSIVVLLWANRGGSIKSFSRLLVNVSYWSSVMFLEEAMKSSKLLMFFVKRFESEVKVLFVLKVVYNSCLAACVAIHFEKGSEELRTWWKALRATIKAGIVLSLKGDVISKVSRATIDWNFWKRSSLIGA